MTQLCNRIIQYSFYVLFFLVPLVFTNSTSELFELNKMWLTFSLTIIIGTAWVCKMIVEKQFSIKRTPLDLPLLLFVLAHIVSTFFSLDIRISLWGYYSRFNGGLLSIVSYVFLYYAFVSNLTKQDVKRVLSLSLTTGLLVALWGLPSHFGKDPTCLLFRGTFDVSCWTDAFKPTIRMFSTLGQPAWLAAYMALLLPIAMARGITPKHDKKATKTTTSFVEQFTIFSPVHGAYILLAILFYLCLLYTNTRAGFLGFWAGNVLFWTVLCWKERTLQTIVSGAVITFLFMLITFFNGTPFAQINQYFSYSALQSFTTDTAPVQTNKDTAHLPALEGGTESGNIRQIVWQGAIDAWKANPWIGTGPETFAFAYYQHRPAMHNMTSEWDYLYNKAHNEYLNYLTTTGIFGLGTYLSTIGLFLFLAAKTLLYEKKLDTNERLIGLALVSGYSTILLTNFFGFSVVIMNLYLFLIPVWFFLLTDTLSAKALFTFPQRQPAILTGKQKVTLPEDDYDLSGTQWIGIIGSLIMALWMLVTLLVYYGADTKYALGYNLYRSGEYETAYNELLQAVEQRPHEPLFKDELSVVSGTLAAAYHVNIAQFPENQQAEAQKRSADLVQEAVDLSNQVTDQHPNIVTYWKSRTRLFYTLSQIDPHYLTLARNAIERAHTLAPTDAKVAYNYGLLLGQTGDHENGVMMLEKTIAMKPDYRDAYFALGLFYRELAVDDKGTVTNASYQEKAVATMRYILEKLSPTDEQTIKTLKTWNVGS